MGSDSDLFHLHLQAENREGAFADLAPVTMGPEAERLAASFRSVCEMHSPQQMEQQGEVPVDALRGMAESGLFGMTIPVEYGGRGLPFSEYLAVVADMAKVDVSASMASLAHLSIGVQGVVLFGNPEQRSRLLPPAASGELLFAYALTEPRVGSDAQHIESTARRSDDGTHYVLNGHKIYITNANYAGAYTVFAQLEGHPPGFMGAFVVLRDSEGLQVGADMPKMGLKASSTAFLRFNGVKVPVENRLGEEGEGFRIAMSILSYGRLAVCAAGVGLMQQSLHDMVQRSGQRHQFGVPIGRFELIQEKLARVQVDEFVASTMVDYAARELERQPTGNFAMETSHCKLFATSRAWQALYDAMQVAGGSGYLASSPYEKRMRDYRVATIFEGTTEIHSIYPAGLLLRALSKQLTGGPAARLWALAKEAMRRVSLPSPAGTIQERRAHRLARRCLRRVRLLGHLGLLVYGKTLSQQEFFLRRLTGLSLHAYALLAALARVRALRREGRDVRGELELLQLFGCEVRTALCKEWSPWSSRQQRMLKSVAEHLSR